MRSSLVFAVAVLGLSLRASAQESPEALKSRSAVITEDNIQQIIKDARVSVVGRESAAGKTASASAAPASASVCAGRERMASDLSRDLGSWEAAMRASKQDDILADAATRKRAEAGVDAYAASNSGVCVDSVVLGFLQDRGALPPVRIVAQGDSISVAATGNGNTLHGAADVSRYARAELGAYLTSVADRRDGGEERLRRMCRDLRGMGGLAIAMPDYCCPLIKDDEYNGVRGCGGGR